MGDQRRQLVQNYEEAKLALLLDVYAELYGKANSAQFEQDLTAGKVSPITKQEIESKYLDFLQRAEKEEAKKRKVGGIFKTAVRKAAVVAATIAATLLLMVSVQAAGIDLFGAVGRWTDNLFHYDIEIKPGQGTAVLEPTLSPVYEIMKITVEHGFPLDLAPTWLPEDFFITDVLQQENKDQKGLTILLENTDGIPIVVQYTKDTFLGSFGNEWIEKDSGEAEMHTSNGKGYYVFVNEEDWTGVFQSDTYRILIIDGLGKDDLLQIIDSIGGTYNE